MYCISDTIDLHLHRELAENELQLPNCRAKKSVEFKKKAHTSYDARTSLTRHTHA